MQALVTILAILFLFAIVLGIHLLAVYGLSWAIVELTGAAFTPVLIITGVIWFFVLNPTKMYANKKIGK